MRERTAITTKELIRFSQGEVTRSQARETEAWLADHPRDRETLARIEQMTRHLKEVDADLEGTDLTSEIRDTIRSAPRSRKQKRTIGRKRLVPMAAAASLIAAVGMVFLMQRTPQSTPPRPDGFRVKADGTMDGDRLKWAGISIYRAGDSGQPKRLGDRLRSGDGLLFTYTNGDETPFKYLMIFALDEAGRVYWYYPAYLQAHTDPSAIPISPGAGELELPEVIRHEMSPGRLVLFGLFADRAVTVKQVEGALANAGANARWSPDRLQRLEFRDTAVQIIQLEVLP